MISLAAASWQTAWVSPCPVILRALCGSVDLTDAWDVIPGLGKTLMTLANIINGKPKRDKRLRTTLIVASPALINQVSGLCLYIWDQAFDGLQWQQEIQTHCQRESESPHGVGMVIQHRAGNRITDPEVLQRAEIVLTTWSEVNRSYPKADVPKELVTAKQKVRNLLRAT